MTKGSDKERRPRNCRATRNIIIRSKGARTGGENFCADQKLDVADRKVKPPKVQFFGQRAIRLAAQGKKVAPQSGAMVSTRSSNIFGHFPYWRETMGGENAA